MNGKKASGKRNIGRTAAQIPIPESCDAKNLAEINGAKARTRTESAKTIIILTTKDALMYSLLFLISPLAKLSETKLTEPEEIPISAREERIKAKLSVAEKIPKSETEMALAMINVNKNPQKARKTFPINRM